MSLHKSGALCRALVLAALACGSSAPVLAADGYAPVKEALDAALEKAVAGKRVAGAVFLVAKNGKLIYHAAAGSLDCEGTTPMREDALFRYSSVSKLFTTMAAAALIHKSVLDLDDPVTRWLPDFKPVLADGTPAVITIRHLMAHQAGLDYGFFEQADGPYIKAGVSDGLDDSGLDLDENLRRIASVPLLYKPGEGWRYSLATDVLGAVIAKANNSSLDVAIRELVTAPAGLGDAGFVAKDPSRLSGACRLSEQGPVAMKKLELVPIDGGVIRFSPDRILDSAAYPSGGAGMAGTARDVLDLLEIVRKGGGPIADSVLLAEMNRDVTNANAMGPGIGFGMGWAVLVDPEKIGAPYTPGSLSWGGVYGHSWFIDPARGISAVLMNNTAIEGMTGPTSTDVVEALYANLP